MQPRNSRCQLKFYSPSDFVRCLDIRQQSDDADGQRFHFAFVGDSRVRQYYFNLLKVIDNSNCVISSILMVVYLIKQKQFVPDYDHPWKDPADHLGNHVSRNVTSTLLHRMIVSFHWQPTFDDEVMQLIASWADFDGSSTVPPHFLLIGISVHHMVKNLGDDHVKMAEGLVRLMSILERLQRRRPAIRIVWLNQPPSIDWIFFKHEMYVRPFSIHSDKIEWYNRMARQIIRCVLMLLVMFLLSH